MNIGPLIPNTFLALWNRRYTLILIQFLFKLLKLQSILVGDYRTFIFCEWNFSLKHYNQSCFIENEGQFVL